MNEIDEEDILTKIWPKVKDVYESFYHS